MFVNTIKKQKSLTDIIKKNNNNNKRKRKIDFKMEINELIEQKKVVAPKKIAMLTNNASSSSLLKNSSTSSTSSQSPAASFYLNDDMLIKFKNNERNLTVVPIDKEAPTSDKYKYTTIIHILSKSKTFRIRMKLFRMIFNFN